MHSVVAVFTCFIPVNVLPCVFLLFITASLYYLPLSVVIWYNAFVLFYTALFPQQN